MKIFKVKKTCELSVQNRKRLFKEGEEVNECSYTKAYPQYFIKIGELNISKPNQKIRLELISRKDDLISTFENQEEILKTNNEETEEKSEKAKKKSKKHKEIDDLDKLLDDVGELEIKEEI